MAEAAREIRPILPMPIRATPYRHQIEAFNFVCELFGLLPGGDRDGPDDVRVPSNQCEARPDRASRAKGG